MLRSLKSIKGLKVEARDGHIGHVDDFYFDDDNWIVRYFIIETGNWLLERKVLISPASVLNADWKRQSISVSLSKEQIENSPPIEEDKPVSRQKEWELTQYYAWPTYWPINKVGIPADEDAITHALEMQELNSENGDEHLRSAHEVFNYNVQASDGHIGSVSDLIVEEESWAIRYLVVNTNKLLPGKKVLLSPSWTELISWSTQTVHADLNKETIKNGPDLNPNEPVNREIEERLYDYYRRPRYWPHHL